MTARQAFGALLLAAAATQPAAAGEPSPSLAASCYGCHAPPASGARPAASTNGIRWLGDRSPAELAARLKLYKAGTLRGTLMNRIARGYSDDELESLAAHFGQAGS